MTHHDNISAIIKLRFTDNNREESVYVIPYFNGRKESIVFYYACIVFINSYKVKTQITLSKKK